MDKNKDFAKLSSNLLYRFGGFLKRVSDSRRLQEFFFESYKAGASTTDICGEGLHHGHLRRLGRAVAGTVVILNLFCAAVL